MVKKDQMRRTTWEDFKRSKWYNEPKSKDYHTVVMPMPDDTPLPGKHVAKTMIDQLGHLPLAEARLKNAQFEVETCDQTKIKALVGRIKRWKGE
jgi:hypothetical protein